MPTTTLRRRPRPRPLHEPLLTFEEFAALDLDVKADLIHGRIVTQMSASTLHERIFMFLSNLMSLFAEERKLGEVLGSRSLVRVDGRNGFEPDLLFVRAERMHVVGEQHLTGAPDVVVEIVSPSSKAHDYATKRDGYERLGVSEYWIVDPERQAAHFHRLDAEGRYADVSPAPGEPFASEAMPGFRFDFDVLFADERPSTLTLVRQMLG